MKKRVLSLFLAITLCLTLTPTGALAADGQPPEQTVSVTQEAETGADENAPSANLEENPTEDAPAAAEKNTADEETGKEAGQNKPTAEGKNEPLALGLDDAGQDAADGENGEAGGTSISGEDTRTEIWCVSKPDSIGRSYDGTTDGGTIPIDLTFTDGTNEIKLKEGTDFTAKKTFDSADAGWHTVTVEIALTGETAVKYKLKAGEETFTIGGNINKAYPKLTVTLSKTACTAGEKLLPLLSVEGAPEDAKVTYYYLASEYKSWAGSSDVEGSEVMPKIDENTAISEPGTYYVYAKTAETTNYEEERSATVALTVNEPAAASVTKADGTDGGTYKTLPVALDAAQDGDTVKLLADHTTNWSDVEGGEYATLAVVRKTLTLDLNGMTVDYLTVGEVVPDEEGGILDSYDGNLTVVDNIQGGSCGKIKDLEFVKGSLAIQGGRIGDYDGSKLTCNENSGNVTISGGTVLGLEVSEGATVTVNGGSAHAGTWFNDGTLNITGGTFGDVRFRNNGGTIAISGGTFDTITNSDASSTIPLMPLLANGYAFYKDNAVQDSTAKTMTDVTVGAHIHVPDEHGKCACGASIIASVKTADGTERTYGSFTDALAAAVESNDSTLQLLYDIDLGDTKYGVSVDSGKFTLDLNSKTLSGKVDYQLLTVSGTADITIKNGKLVNTFSHDSPAMNRGLANAIQITGGTAVLENVEVTSGCGENGEHTDAVCLSDGNLTVANGTFTGAILVMPKTADQHPVLKITSATLHNGIGYFIWNTSNPDYDGVKALFADGSLLFDKDGNYIDITNAAYWQTDSSEEESFTATIFAYGEECSVKPHTHTIVNGKCDCGASYVASVTAGEDVTYYDTFGSALSYATKNNGCTLKLLADVTGTTVMINNPFIFDLNGHSVDALSVDAKATIKDSGTTKGRIGKVTVFNEKVTDLTLGSLLEEGYAFKYGNGYWANDSYLQTTEGSFVTVEKAPIQSVNVYAKDKNNQEILTIAYGATGEVTLVSNCKLSETSGENLSCAWYKLTDDTAIPPLEGAAGTSYKLPADLPAGTYTYRVTFTSDYYSKSAEITITVTPISLVGATVTVSNLTYNGNPQEPTVTVKLGDETLSRDNDYTVQVTKQTDAGSYKLTIKGGGNYSGEIKDVEWKIEPMKIDSVMVSSDISKVYDGTAEINMSANEWATALKFKTLSASGVVDVPSEAYTISDAYFVEKSGEETIYSPDAGEKYGITFKITLNDDNYVLQTYGEDTPSTSKVITQSGGAIFTIAQADAPTNIRNGALNVINGTTLEYTYDAKQILPAAPNGTYGTVLYSGEPSSDFESGYTVNSFKVGINSGVLTLTIDAQNGGKTGKIGSVTIYVTTDNYESFDLPLDLYAVDQIKPEPDGTITATPITYGNELSKSEISGKMKDPNTGDAVNGTFAWTDGTIKPAASDNYEAEWTFTPAAGYEKYATATGTVTIKVNKAAPTFTAPTAQENLTYTGQEQALITAGMTDHGTIKYSLTENGTYSQDIPTGTDAGAYTVWYRVIGDANHNDTAPASVAVSIRKKPLTITGVTAASKPYDGTKDAGITSVTFDGVNLNRGTDYTVTANFDDAGVGKSKNVTATVTLMGQAAKNYALEQSSFTATGSITKAAAPRSGLRPAVTVINDLAKTYEMVLSNDYLPKLSSPCEYGNVSYSLGSTHLTDGYKDTVQVKVMEENGQYKLKLTVPAVDYNKVSSVGTLRLYVSSDNYQDFPLDIGVKAKNKDVPVPDGPISASDITYGQALNDSKIAGKMKAGGKAIDGTFTWTNGTFKPAAGDYPASWTFTPAKGYEEYATATGTATVTVDPKAVTVSITPNGGTYGSVTAAAAVLSGVVDGETVPVTLTYTGTANDGTAYAGTTPPTKAGTYTITATTTNPNYTLDPKTTTADFTIAKRPATVTPDNKSKVYEEKDPKLTYKVSGVLDGETLEGITLARVKDENAGKYAITATADASANPNYDVTFAEGTFTIEPKSIKGATVVLGKGLAANGAEQTQTVEKVLLGDKEIPADSYTVTGNTATAYGIYTLTITAKGNYTDSITWTYVIAPSKAEDAPGEEITIGSGKVKVVVLPEGAVPSVGLLTDKAELLAMLVNSGDITADELVQIANGASVDIVLTVKEANVPDVVKTAMAQAAKGYTIGQYLDISLFKYMTVNGNRQPGAALHTTKNALPISVVVPDALINTNSAVNRTYCIVRNHEGTIDVLDAAFDATGKTLTFKTDRFSIYAIAYKDTAVPSSGSNPGSNNSSNDSETKKNEVAPTPASTSKPSTITAMPQTGDTSNPTLYVVLLVASLLGLAVVFVCKKRNDK